MNLENVILVSVVILYTIIAILAINNNRKHKKVIKKIQNKNNFYLFGFEKSLLEATGMQKSKAKKYIILIRIIALSLMVVIVIKFGFIALFLFCGVLILIYSNTQNKKLIESTGINYIIIVNEFLDSYIPAISSGLSNDQAMLKFVHSQNDENLFSWWVNRGDPNFELDIKWKRISEVYEMVKFNEERGINDSLPIIEQMQKDLNSKQEFYDDYESKIGEIKPIMLSYYIGLPIILAISWKQAASFWNSIGGLVCAFALSVLFFAYEMFLSKIRKSTIETMF